MPLPQYLPQYLTYARFLLDADLSHTSKLLYTLLLDRATLSQKNNWVDNQGRIYVIYPLSNLAKDLGCCVSSVTRSFAELEKAELAERVRSGFSKPSHILLKVPHTVQNCAVTVCTSAQSDRAVVLLYPVLHFVSGRNGKSQRKRQYRASRTTPLRKEKAYKDD